jgi:hypothetical protein
MVSVLAIGHKFRGFRPGRGRWIFKGDKNTRHSFFREEVKPSSPRRKILRYVKKNSVRYDRDTTSAKFNIPSQLPASVLNVCCNQSTGG